MVNLVLEPIFFGSAISQTSTLCSVADFCGYCWNPCEKNGRAHIGPGGRPAAVQRCRIARCPIPPWPLPPAPYGVGIVSSPCRWRRTSGCSSRRRRSCPSAAAMTPATWTHCHPSPSPPQAVWSGTPSPTREGAKSYLPSQPLCATPSALLHRAPTISTREATVSREVQMLFGMQMFF